MNDVDPRIFNMGFGLIAIGVVIGQYSHFGMYIYISCISVFALFVWAATKGVYDPKDKDEDDYHG